MTASDGGSALPISELFHGRRFRRASPDAFLAEHRERVIELREAGEDLLVFGVGRDRAPANRLDPAPVSRRTRRSRGSRHGRSPAGQSNSRSRCSRDPSRREAGKAAARSADPARPEPGQHFSRCCATVRVHPPARAEVQERRVRDAADASAGDLHHGRRGRVRLLRRGAARSSGYARRPAAGVRVARRRPQWEPSPDEQALNVTPERRHRGATAGVDRHGEV